MAKGTFDAEKTAKAVVQPVAQPVQQPYDWRALLLSVLPPLFGLGLLEIGRASCRERV